MKKDPAPPLRLRVKPALAVVWLRATEGLRAVWRLPPALTADLPAAPPPRRAGAPAPLPDRQLRRRAWTRRAGSAQRGSARARRTRR